MSQDRRIKTRPDGMPPRLADTARPTAAQRRWLVCGLGQPGGKLPLFDADGQRVPERTIRSCVAHGWAEPWFENPLKRDWLVCRLTPLGRVAAGEEGTGEA